jgi:class 3 adenylate cyclase/predicted ATPase
VPACAVCGYDAAEAFKFCPQCGAAAATRTSEQRKVVTVLFCDVVGSTALGESIDPETLRATLARYFGRMKAIVERHGGTVEKFIGDAVMAVFGVPVVHEDDALRACRAAIEMREAFPELGVEGRLGVTTGEVVTGTEERLATGDAVNVAARLQQAAQPGEALVGEETLALVRAAVDVEAVEPLALKGKAEPVRASRLVAVRDAAERRPKVGFVGRERELAAIHEAWERALADRRCELVTIVGEAGVGKSRLVAEALASVQARLVQGRCLPYGEGITYWPVVEVIRQLGTSSLDGAAAAAIGSVLGKTEVATTSAEEIAWAFRKLLQEQAPLIAVFDDIQWGEETFLDLLEHVALLSSGAPILLLGVARPELTERRAGWPVTLRLEPLGAEEVEELIPGRISGELRAKIVRAGGGNPLFVQEMVAMAGEAGGDVAVPPTLQALLAARLDQLDQSERRMLERGAVEGEIFHRGGVQALAPEETQVTPRLAALVRKGLIRPGKSLFVGEDGFRFRHLLIRDAAYSGLPKATRAELHQRFAAWLESRDTDLVELDELLGYHLEQAYRYQVALGSVQADARHLASRASQRLESAGRRALARSDLAAAINLLQRSADLLDDDARRAELLPELGAAQMEAGNFAEAEAILAEAGQLARSAEDERAESRVLVEQQFLGLLRLAEEGTDEAARLVERVIRVFERHDDQHGLCRARRLQGTLHWIEARAAAAAESWQQAAAHARQAGDENERSEILCWVGSSLLFGPVPVSEGIRRCELMRAELAGNLASEAEMVRSIAGLHAMEGRFDLARSLLATSDHIFEELGRTLNSAISHAVGIVELLAGDPAAAETSLRVGYEALEEMGERAYLSTTAAYLAQAIFAQGRHEEAEQLTELSEQLSASCDLATQVMWRGVRARILGDRGETGPAERLAQEAVALAGRSDFLNHRADALMDLAQVLQAGRRVDESAQATAQALALYEEKGNVAGAARARGSLATLAQV